MAYLTIVSPHSHQPELSAIAAQVFSGSAACEHFTALVVQFVAFMMVVLPVVFVSMGCGPLVLLPVVVDLPGRGSALKAALARFSLLLLAAAI